jgi:hypothetical protein
MTGIDVIGFLLSARAFAESRKPGIDMSPAEDAATPAPRAEILEPETWTAGDNGSSLSSVSAKS